MTSTACDPGAKDRFTSRELRGWLWDEAQEGTGRYAFSRARFPNESDGFSFGDLEAHTIYCVSEAPLGGEPNGKILYGEKRGPSHGR